VLVRIVGRPRAAVPVPADARPEPACRTTG
jgi:hypothetical protein